MNNGIGYILFLGLMVGLLYFITEYNYLGKHATVTKEAMEPDELLDNTKFFVEDHAYKRGLGQLEEAIRAMRKIEDELDEESKEILENSIADLQVVYNEILTDSLVMDDLNNSFSKALNALTLAELRISEFFLDSHHSRQATIALKYGMYHLTNALKYTNGAKKDYEIHIYQEIDSLLAHDELSYHEKKEKIEFMIKELGELVE